MLARRLSPALVLLALAAGCGTSGALRSGEIGATDEGLASFYSPALNGRPTASGERYDHAAMTAAHRFIPFGTWVLVERTDGADRRVTVRINDRGPFVSGRVIDLSGAAARAIGLERVGVAPVRVRILRRDKRQR